MSSDGKTSPPMTPLRAALIAGDLPTAELWLALARTATKPFERGVATMEALADPLLDDPSRSACSDELVTSIEDWLALEEPGAAVLLAALLADPVRYQVQGQRARLAKIARLMDVGLLQSGARKRYESTREAMIDRPPRRTAREVWRIDAGGGVVPRGADVPVPHSTAVALAELRAAAARLCALLSEEAIGRFADHDGNFARLEVRCATSYLAELRAQVNTLATLAATARAELATRRR